MTTSSASNNPGTRAKKKALKKAAKQAAKDQANRQREMEARRRK
jgi:hypothetical protein